MELNETILLELQQSLHLKQAQIQAVLTLLSEDKTVAFIARYRKEATGALNEEQIRQISEAYQYALSLKKKKEDIKRLIDEKGLLTDEISKKIEAASKLIELEDLYRPYKEKKKTKATEAIALGLEPLAVIMLELRKTGDKENIVKPFLNDFPFVFLSFSIPH